MVEPFAAARDDERLHVLHDVRDRPAGAFLQQGPFVIIQRQPVRDGNEALEIVAGEQRHGLARIEDERDAGGLELFGVLQHAFTAVRSDNTNRYTVIRRHLDAVRMIHGARMERGDLVGIEVRGDESLRAMLVRDRDQVLLGHALLLHPLASTAEIQTDAAHRITDVAEQLQVVRDVARAAAELPAHLGHQKRHVEHVQLVGKDVRFETVREHHDGVVGDRSTDECALVFARHANGLRVRNGAQRYSNHVPLARRQPSASENPGDPSHKFVSTD